MKKGLQILITFLFFGQMANAQADLIVVPGSLSAGPNPVHVGITTDIAFSVQNTGNAASGTTIVGIYISVSTNPEAGLFLGNISLESLAAGTSSNNIQCKFPIPYTVGSSGNFNIIVKINPYQSITESSYSNNSDFTPIFIDADPWSSQNIPYPIIFIHGLKGANTTWNELIDSLQNFYGWSYGGNMNFCLNFDANVSTSNKNNDYHDFTDISTLQANDYYTVNFDVNFDGTAYANSNINESNQSAIVKQGLAVRDAIKHVLQKTGRDKVVLVGHSMGGLAAREYLQNPSIWEEPGVNHHVAKLVTIGTPHGGNNSFHPDIFGLLAPDLSSEAVRDLRKDYTYSYYYPLPDLSNDSPGAYLFGGVEDLDYLRDQFCCNFYNADINCDGNVSGQPISGINQRSIPTNLSYSASIGIVTNPLSWGYINNGDGVVSTTSANINNYLLVNARIFDLPESGGPWPIWNPWHVELTKQFAGIMKGVDEPNESFNNHAYEVSSGQLYYGNITCQSNSCSLKDYDNYKINVPSNGNLNIQVYNIPISMYFINIFNSSNNSIYAVSSNGKSYVNINVPVTSGNYYIVFSGTPAASSYKYPYAFKCTFSQITTYCNSTVNLTATSAVFSDGSGSNNYSNNSDCKWKIQPSGATSITLSFSAFDVSNPLDTVYVYDGGGITSPLLGKWTGNSLPSNVTSTGGTMFVRFLTDATNVAPGWTANYTSVTVPTYCNGTTILTAATGTFSDGSNTIDYGNNANCSWLINPAEAFSITLNFLAFNTESANDVVNVYDGSDNTATLLGSFSGNSIPSSITSSGGAMFVEFLTNSNTTASGWNASYTSYIPVSSAGIVEYEYWFDSDYTNVVSTPIMPQNVFELNSGIPTSGLLPSLHSFHIRFKDNNGLWSSVLSNFFIKSPASYSGNKISQYEYWFDNDYANVVSTIITPQPLLQLNSNIPTANLPMGLHSFHIRFKDIKNQWSSVASSFFYNPVQSLNNKVIKYRYWFDNAPLEMTVVTLPNPVSQLLLLENICTANLSLGSHQVHFQFQDSLPLWSSVLSTTFEKLTATPVLAITTNPLSQNVIAPAGENFIVAATGSDNIYQWQVSTNNGATWTNITGIGTVPTYSGWNSTTLTVSNTVIDNSGYRYRCVVSNICPGATATSNSATLIVGTGLPTPDLTNSQLFSTSQIIAGGVIDELIVVRNVGPLATSAPIRFSVTNYSMLSGLTVASNASPSVTIGFTTYTLDNANWAFNSITGEFTSNAGIVINPGQTRLIGVRITRAGGANGSVTHSSTIAAGTGGGETQILNNSISNTLLKN